MCDQLATGYGAEFQCSANCPKKRSCSPVIYPEPFLLYISNDTKGHPNLDLAGNGCCVYKDMFTASVETTSKNACLYLCSILVDCLAVTVSTSASATPCRHHMKPPQGTLKLDQFHLGCKEDASGQSLVVSDRECWLNESILFTTTSVPTTAAF